MECGGRGKDGDPGLIRTADTQFRKLLLYPSELRGHFYNQRVTAKLKTDRVTFGHSVMHCLHSHGDRESGME